MTDPSIGTTIPALPVHSSTRRVYLTSSQHKTLIAFSTQRHELAGPWIQYSARLSRPEIHAPNVNPNQMMNHITATPSHSQNVPSCLVFPLGSPFLRGSFQFVDLDWCHRTILLARSALVEPFLHPRILSSTPYSCLDKHSSCSCAFVHDVIFSTCSCPLALNSNMSRQAELITSLCWGV